MTGPPAPTDASARWRQAAALGCFTALSLLCLHPYHFGIGDQELTLPIVKAYLDPGLYPGDYLLEVRHRYFTFLWRGLAAAARLSGLGLPELFFGAYLLCLVASLRALQAIFDALFGDFDATCLALALSLVASRSLAPSSLIESSLLTRTAALPVALFALQRCLLGRWRGAFLLLGASLLIHPHTGAFAAAMLVTALLLEARALGRRQVLQCLAILLAAAAPILAWRASASPERLAGLFADPRWLEILRLRSSFDLFPSAWTWDRWLETLAYVSLWALGERRAPEGERHRAARRFAYALLGVCVIGTLGVAWIPVTALIQWHPGRSLIYLVPFAAAYCAKLCVDWLGGRFAAHRRAAALAATALVLAAGRAVEAEGPPRPLRLASDQPAAWLYAQLWARSQTPRSALFIVPPSLGGFRAGSERSVYAEWRDGTMSFWDPELGEEWLRRMRSLGLTSPETLWEDYLRLREPAFSAIAGAHAGRAVFAVVPQGRHPLSFPVAYRNEEFAVYRIDEVSGGGRR
ncbi:MAG: hypothetical protein HY554_00960 [Elusimicrobia bacterium]|nr:hypothetical protein [Elusimicrobiota bacterium]